MPQRLTLTLSFVAPTFNRLKRLSLARSEHDPCPLHPIRAFTVNQMADDIERAPSVFTFISDRPRFRQIAQKRVESSGGASEKRYGVLQVMFHPASQFVDADFPEALIAFISRRMRRGQLR